MRLLNTLSFELHEFRSDIPPYAILSHTWEEEEVTFEDIADWHRTGLPIAKAGGSKINNACAYARKYMFEWIWIDSCCIDKSSSAELSEAINSMYQYYEDAEVCYVFLCDASSQENPKNPNSAFRSSRWFRRGWTLQELIVPLYAVFLVNANSEGTEWTEIGTRWSLRYEISAITSVPVQVFEGHSTDEFSIAQKMSWAAFRETTRPEDQAYCLMGLFNVSMPPIYGEGGAKAFMRLQQEIIKISDDRSIFAWISTSEDPSELRGLLARSPEEFRASGEVQISETDESGDISSFSFTNNGLRIYLPILPTPTDDLSAGASMQGFLAPLHCRSKKGDNFLSIYLKQIGKNQYARCRPNEVVFTSPDLIKDLKEVIVKEYSPPRKTRRKSRAAGSHIFDITILPPAQGLLELTDIRKLVGTFDAIGLDANNMAIHVQTEAGLILKDAFVQLLLIYRSAANSAGETFSVVFGARNNTGIVTAIVSEDPSIPASDMPADRAALSLGLGGLLVGLQMTGQWPRIVLEFSHQNNPLISTSMVPSVNLGFRVPRTLFVQNSDYESTTTSLELENVFPPGFYDSGLNSKSSHSREVYLSMPAVAHKDMLFRLLTYSETESDFKLYVAFGFHATGEAWIDLFTKKSVTDDGQKKTQGVVWQFYLNSGLWRKASSSASSDIFGDWRVIATAIQKSSALQLGSHSLLFEFGLFER
ncbi:hypothetical protein VKT23_007993 [Stygiomarasmius scandens]|uniref:HET-domain-containing protein n=1 Tax=Marasmiellus scandens TaxID=2682957 RepID=A0ABR1JQ63_9AGAR